MNYNGSISAPYDSLTPAGIQMYQDREIYIGNLSPTMPANSVASEVNFQDLLAMSFSDLSRSAIPAPMADLQSTTPIVVNNLISQHPATVPAQNSTRSHPSSVARPSLDARPVYAMAHAGATLQVVENMNISDAQIMNQTVVGKLKAAEARINSAEKQKLFP